MFLLCPVRHGYGVSTDDAGAGMIFGAFGASRVKLLDKRDGKYRLLNRKRLHIGCSCGEGLCRMYRFLQATCLTRPFLFVGLVVLVVAVGVGLFAGVTRIFYSLRCGGSWVPGAMAEMLECGS